MQIAGVALFLVYLPPLYGTGSAIHQYTHDIYTHCIQVGLQEIMASDTLDSTSTTTLRVGILIVSTTAFAGTTTDLTTDLLRKSFTQANESTPPASTQWQVTNTKIIPDDPEQIQASIRAWTDASADIHLIVTSGGTGFTESDKTPDVCITLCIEIRL